MQGACQHLLPTGLEWRREVPISMPMVSTRHTLLCQSIKTPGQPCVGVLMWQAGRRSWFGRNKGSGFATFNNYCKDCATATSDNNILLWAALVVVLLSAQLEKADGNDNCVSNKTLHAVSLLQQQPMKHCCSQGTVNGRGVCSLPIPLTLSQSNNYWPWAGSSICRGLRKRLLSWNLSTSIMLHGLGWVAVSQTHCLLIHK